MNQHWIGEKVRAIETGWTGRVVSADERGLLEVHHADVLAMAVNGWSFDEAIDSDDVGWYDAKDVELVPEYEQCEVCAGDGKVPDQCSWSVDTGTKWQRNYSQEVIVDCPECNGSGMVQIGGKP